jgi:hypothetical protein
VRKLDNKPDGKCDTPFAFQPDASQIQNVSYMLKYNPIFIFLVGAAVFCFSGCDKLGLGTDNGSLADGAVEVKPEIAGAVVGVFGRSQNGGGFFCEVGGKPYVLTSESALAEESGFTVQSLNGVVMKPKKLFVSADSETLLIELMEQPLGIQPLKALRLPTPEVKLGDVVVTVGVRDRMLSRSSSRLESLGGDQLTLLQMQQSASLGSAVVHQDTGKALGVILQRPVFAELSNNVQRDAQMLSQKLQPERYVQRLDQLQKWEPIEWAVYHQNEAALKRSASEITSLLVYLSGRGHGVRDFLELYSAHQRCATTLATPNISKNDSKEAKNRLFRDLESLLRRAESRCAGSNLTFGQRARGAQVRRMVSLCKTHLEKVRGDVSLSELIFKSRSY